jgi:hypothetical protein
MKAGRSWRLLTARPNSVLPASSTASGCAARQAATSAAVVGARNSLPLRVRTRGLGTTGCVTRREQAAPSG